MRNRAHITNVFPRTDNKSHYLKRVTGGLFTVQANIFTDGRDTLHAAVLYKLVNSKNWTKIEMLENHQDTYSASFLLEKEGVYAFKIHAYVGDRSDLATEFLSLARIRVGRMKEIFSTWYEMFPRSASPEPQRPGNLNDCEKLLPRIAKMGFDTILFPPIFPIGFTKRKGKNNLPECTREDVGSPWSVGNESGGHKNIHSELGDFEHFNNLIQAAKLFNIEIALDFGLRCSIDHPLVKSNPHWFHQNANGLVVPEENPPYSYRDIVNFNFECADWQNLWQELKSIVEFWIEKGIKIFFSKSTHHKPFAFWNWLINEIQDKHPDVMFVSGALVRPLLRNELAKTGFSQSLTTIMWKNQKSEIEEFVNGLVNTEVREYLRPNFFTNTPDVLPASLTGKSENSFLIRYALVATLSSNCGIYGPAFELCENEENPFRKEEYNHSEKYEVRHHNWETENRLVHFITIINSIRKEQPALQRTFNITFTKTDNEQLISFIKQTQDGLNTIWCIINLDPDNVQSGFVEMPKELLGIKGRGMNLRVTELMTGETYHWFNDWNYVELKPANSPIHLLKVGE
jgi:starch synthase (maltosyl-transferring)